MAAPTTPATQRDRPFSLILTLAATFVLVAISAAAAERNDPVITFVTPTSGQTLSGLQKWEVGVSEKENAVEVEFYVDGQEAPLWVGQRPPFVFGGDLGVLDTTKLSNGAHVLRVRVVSPGKNNVDTASITVDVQNSSTPPPSPSDGAQVSIVTPSAGETVSGGVRWEAGVPAGTSVSVVDFFVDDATSASWSEQVAPYVYNGDAGVLDTTALSDGTHQLRVRLVSTNATTSSASVSVNVANQHASSSTAPAAPVITSAPSATTTSTSASFEFATSTSGATLECSLDGAPLTTCTSPKTYTALAVGKHTFGVRAVAGGLSSSVTSYTWRIESTTSLSSIVVATPTITSHPTNPTTATTASFAYSSTTAGATYQCSLDGAAYQACGATISYTGLAPASHTFAVRALAGTSTSSRATYTWQVSALSTSVDAYFSWNRVSDIPDLHDGDRGRLADVVLPVMPAGASSVIRANVTDLLDSSAGGDGSYGTTGNRSEPWAKEGTDTWISMWMLIPNGTDSRFPGTWKHSVISSGWNTFLEFHEPGIAPRSTHFGAWGSDPPVWQMSHAAGNPSSPTDRWVRDTQPIVYNQWQRWLIHIYWHRTSGYIEWWIDDRQIVGRSSRTVLPSGGIADSYPTLWDVNGTPIAGYFQAGHYRGPSRADQDTTYLSRVTVGPSRASVGG